MGLNPETPIKVLRVVSRLNVGGPAQHVIYLTEKLNDQNFQSILVSGVEDEMESNMLDLAEQHGVKVTRFSMMRRSLSIKNDFLALIAMIREIIRFRPHIIHTHTAKAGAIGRLAGWLCGVPIIIHTFHGHVLEGYFSPLKTKFFIAVEKFLASRSDWIITLTRRLESDLNDLMIKGKNGIRILPLGLDLERFLKADLADQSFRQSLGLGPEAILAGIVGRLVPIKRHADLLQAMRQVKHKLPHLHVAIIGGGELEPELKRLVQDYGLGDRVHFCGFRNRLEAIYPSLDWVVLCSGNEGMPVSLIEAMTTGVPILATDVGGVADLLLDCPSCTIVPAERPDKLASELVEFYQNYQLYKQRAVGFRHTAYQRFRLERLVEDIRNLYLQTIEQRGLR